MSRPVTPTPVQLELLRFIAENTVMAPRTPSQDDIRKHFGWSSQQAAGYHIAQLRRAGLIERNPHKHHSFIVTGAARALLAEMATFRLGDVRHFSTVDGRELTPEETAQPDPEGSRGYVIGVDHERGELTISSEPVLRCPEHGCELEQFKIGYWKCRAC